MQFSVDIKRLILTATACFIAAILPFTLTNSVDLYPFLLPPLISVSVTLTSFDRIITKRKYQAFVKTTLLTILLLFFSIFTGVAFGNSFFGSFGIYLMCVLSGILTLLIFSFSIKIENLKFGLIVTSLLALTTPFLNNRLKGQKILNLDFVGDPAMFFMIFQTIIGLALAISIWTKTTAETKQI